MDDDCGNDYVRLDKEDAAAAVFIALSVNASTRFSKFLSVKSTSLPLWDSRYLTMLFYLCIVHRHLRLVCYELI